MVEKNAPDNLDIESGPGRRPESISHWKLLIDQGVLTTRITNHHYDGKGTEDEPYLVTWIENDPRNPLLFAGAYKWMVTILIALETVVLTFCSSAYTGSFPTLRIEFGASQEVMVLGLSLFVLGFAVGPLLWAPLSEIYGRQIVYFGTFAAFTAFTATTTCSSNIWTVIILRFWAGTFGSSPTTNAGGVIADLFSARERSGPMALYASAPFMGPVLGPIVGGFLGEIRPKGWVWIEGVLAILGGSVWIIGSFPVPETYPPVLLRKRAAKLSKITGKVYRTQNDIDGRGVKLTKLLKTSLLRPWILLFKEPIVLLLSIYMAIVYGTLYLLFGAYPIVYQQHRGWGQGIGGLPFLSCMIGMLIAVAYNSVFESKRYLKVMEKAGGLAPPEARLPLCAIGGVALPIGLFWFAWTNSPSVPWIVSVLAGAPFGFGMCLVFIGIINYLVDSYTIFAASVIAGNGIIRSVFGAAFPLFTAQMYAKLGIHWATTIPAFLSLACLPFPFLFYKYGAAIRARCKYAAEADLFMKKLRGQDRTEEERARNEGEEQDTSDDSYEQERNSSGSEQIRIRLDVDESTAIEATDDSNDANMFASGPIDT